MDKNEYVRFLQGKGILKYVTDFISCPMMLIDNVTGDNKVYSDKNKIVFSVDTYSFKNDTIKSRMERFDKCYVLFNDDTRKYYKDKIRFYGWNKPTKDFECTIKISETNMKNLLGKGDGVWESERESQRLRALHHIGNLVMIEYGPTLKTDTDKIKEIEKCIGVLNNHPISFFRAIQSILKGENWKDG